jgi:hypothetical protein
MQTYMERKRKAFDFLAKKKKKKEEKTLYIICNSLNVGNATTFIL